MVYLDYAANSPVNEEVLDLFYNTTKKYYANPNSLHSLGIEALNLLNKSTSHIAHLLNIKEEEIIYTSGASESNNLAVKGICNRYKNRGKHIIVSVLEHTSVIAPATLLKEQGFDVDIVNIKKDGLIDLDELKSLIREDTILVSITSVDSELGIVQPIEQIGEIIKNYPNCFFHTDASQAIGKFKIDFKNVDLITIAPHKFYGMNGFGMLIKKSGITLTPIINGGKSTTIYRSGTPVLASVVALDKALDLAIKNMDERNIYINKLNKILIDNFLKYKNVSINSSSHSVNSIINISIKGIKSLDFMKELEKEEIYISTKAACCGALTPSKSVYAISKDKSASLSSLRISLSYLTTEEEINEFIKGFDKCYKRMCE